MGSERRVAGARERPRRGLERTGHDSSAAEVYRAALNADSTYAKARVSLPRVDGKSDETPIDVREVAAKIEESLQSAKEVQLMAKGPAPAQP